MIIDTKINSVNPISLLLKGPFDTIICPFFFTILEAIKFKT